MDFRNDLLDIISLYVSDLKKNQTLNESQQSWLGLALDSEKMLGKLIQGRDLNSQVDCEYLILGIINKLRRSYDDLLFATNSSSKTAAPIPSIVSGLLWEMIEFKKNGVPDKSSRINSFLEILPPPSRILLFDLMNYFWLLPFSLLVLCQHQLQSTQVLPTLPQLTNEFNSLQSVEEIKKIHTYSILAREQLISSLLVYVKFFAFKFRNRGLDYEDVIQEGNIGVIKAVDKFDVRKEVSLKTFALWWIKQSIMRAVANDSRTIRFPVHKHDVLMKLIGAYRQCQERNILNPTNDTLSKLSGIKVDIIPELINLLQTPDSLETLQLCENSLMSHYFSSKLEFGILLCTNCFLMADLDASSDIPKETQNPTTIDSDLPFCLDYFFISIEQRKSDRVNFLLKKLAYNPTDENLFNIQLSELREQLDLEFEKLRPRQSKILNMRYGLNNGESLTLEEVGAKMNVTRERIRQIESESFVVLRKSLSLRKYLDLI